MTHANEKNGQAISPSSIIKYSICITNFNSNDTIKASIESILSQVNDNFEIIICDNYSTDGSRKYLQQLSKEGKIKLYIEKSSRGKGRQIAFEKSKGKYIISGIDTDDRLKKNFHTFLELYHKKHEGYMLSSGTIHIIPRHIVKELGGWRDLTWGEDVDFHKRAIALGKHHNLKYSTDLVERGDNKRSLIARLYERYDASKCYYRIGKTVSQQIEMAVLPQKPIIMILAVSALIMCKIKGVKKFDYSK